MNVCIIAHAVVAQSCLLVQRQHENSARPGTVRHPEISVVIIEDTGVNAVRPHIAPLPVIHTVLHIALGNLLRPQNLRRIRLSEVSRVEAAIDHRSDIGIRPGHTVCGEHDNIGLPVVAVCAQIHTILLQNRIINNVRCPEIAKPASGTVIVIPCPDLVPRLL